jgi:hypothetical protein
MLGKKGFAQRRNGATGDQNRELLAGLRLTGSGLWLLIYLGVNLLRDHVERVLNAGKKPQSPS